MKNKNVIVWNEQLKDYIAYGDCASKLIEIKKGLWVLTSPETKPLIEVFIVEYHKHCYTVLAVDRALDKEIFGYSVPSIIQARSLADSIAKALSADGKEVFVDMNPLLKY